MVRLLQVLLHPQGWGRAPGSIRVLGPGVWIQRRSVIQLRSAGITAAAMVPALPRTCIHRLICTPGSPSPMSSWLCPTTKGTTAASPAIPETNAAVVHQGYCLNTVQAVTENPDSSWFSYSST